MMKRLVLAFVFAIADLATPAGAVIPADLATPAGAVTHRVADDVITCPTDNVKVHHVDTDNVKVRTFVIANDVVSRSFEWDGTTLVDRGVGAVRSESLVRGGESLVYGDESMVHGDESSARGRESASGSDVIFASGRKFKATDVTLEHVAVPTDTLREGFDKWVLSFREGDLLVRKEYRLYAGVKAIACDNYFSVAQGAQTTVAQNWVLERVQLPSMHYVLKTVEFWDATDNHDNLVRESESFPFYKNNYRGNLLFAAPRSGGDGVWMLKEAPTSRSQLAYTGRDFSSDGAALHMVGVGVVPSDLAPGVWTKGYSSVVGLYDGTALGASVSLRMYQKKLRRHIPERDEMVMMNTWGDRSQDAKVGEKFCIEEVQKANRLGISHFQIDDGWQSGKSPNSATKGGSFKNIWDNPDYWTPDPVKYPRGLAPVVEAASELGMTLGLWYNPSIKNNFSNWKDDADAIIGLWRKYGIKVYKIDGVELPCKEAEANFRRILDTVLEATGGDVVFNLDVTAGRRGGYFMFNEYGNLFLENRYSDWGNYYPYRSLRNLWMLSRYVPAENIQLEFLNNWRNHDKYASGDALAPARYSFEYLFGLTMAGQPLAWMEASNLPEEGFDIAPLVRAYREVAPAFHSGVILPIGDEPDGYAWTGFQSICSEKEGYLLVYRELSEDQSTALETWLPEGAKVDLQYVLGSSVKGATGEEASQKGMPGKSLSPKISTATVGPSGAIIQTVGPAGAITLTVGPAGTITMTLPQPNTFALLHYSIR